MTTPMTAATWYERKRTRDVALVACFLLPALTIFFLYRILPLGWNFWLAFHSWSPLKPAKFIGLEHFEEMLLDDDVFWQALVNTLVFIGCSPLAIALALAMRRAKRLAAEPSRAWQPEPEASLGALFTAWRAAL